MLFRSFVQEYVSRLEVSVQFVGPDYVQLFLRRAYWYCTWPDGVCFDDMLAKVIRWPGKEYNEQMELRRLWQEQTGFYVPNLMEGLYFGVDWLE